MEPKEYVLWLQGYADGIGSNPPTKAQWDKIRSELALTFNKITPYRPNVGGVDASPKPVTPLAPTIQGAVGGQLQGLSVNLGQYCADKKSFENSFGVLPSGLDGVVNTYGTC
jgi:hypothetical protein